MAVVSQVHPAHPTPTDMLQMQKYASAATLGLSPTTTLKHAGYQNPRSAHRKVPLIGFTAIFLENIRGSRRVDCVKAHLNWGMLTLRCTPAFKWDINTKIRCISIRQSVLEP